MLTNTLKRLIFLARSTKKSSSQPTSQTSTESNGNKQQKSQYSHPLSPTLKKMQKRFNEGSERQLKQQQDLMKGFEQFRKNIVQENERKKRNRDVQKEVQQQLKNLQVPADLRERFRKIRDGQKVEDNQFANKKLSQSSNSSLKHQNNAQTQLDSQTNEFGFPNNFQQIRLSSRSIKSKQAQDQIKSKLFKKYDKEQPQKLRQEMLINQILKNSKGKQAQLNLPQDWKKQVEQKNKQKQQQTELINQKIRYEKLQQIASGKQDGPNKKKSKQLALNNTELRRLEMMKEKHKIQVSPDQIWRSKYSPQLIQSAMNYKNKQLHYFKQLIEGEERHKWDQRRERGYLKPNQQNKLQRAKSNQQVKKIKDQQKMIKGTEIKAVQQQGLTRAEDLQFYREKGLKQFQQSQKFQEYEKNLIQQSEKDYKLGNKISQMFIDDFIDPEEKRLERIQKYQNSTFGKYQRKLRQMSEKLKNLGISYDYEDLKLMKKQTLFSDKKLQEENQSYKQYLLKKQKKKNMKQQLQKIHKQKLREDLNFDYQVDPVKLQKLNPFEMQEGLRKMQEIQKLKESTLVSKEFLKQKIHHIKTLKAMTQFISAYFYTDFQNTHNQIKAKVQVGNIIPNRKNTVLNIFWQFHQNYRQVMEKLQFSQEDIQREKKAIQTKIQKQSTYISSKMTQYLELRYGPDIRFHYDEKLQETKMAYQQMKKYKNEIVDITLEQYKEKGAIKNPQDEQEYRKKIDVMITNNLEDINNQKKLINKFYIKKQKLKASMQRRKQLKRQKQAAKNRQSKSQSEPIVSSKKRLSEKDLSELQLQKIFTSKSKAKKQQMFTPQVLDQQLYFGKQRENLNIYANNLNSNEKKVDTKVGRINKASGAKKESINQEQFKKYKKRSPVQRMWVEIQQKGI